MRPATLATVLAAATSLVAGNVAVIGAETPAKILFGKAQIPTEGKPRPIGSYAKGCMAGAEALPIDGPNWQVMRLSRNRNWGQPELIDYIKKFSSDAAKDGWPGLLIGDMAQPRGGPMATGHASHQIGLDTDIWFVPMPPQSMTRDEREKKAAVSLLMTGRLTVDPAKWTAQFPRLLERAVSYPEVARIFVSPAIKQQLCETVGTDRAWLRKLRPWWGHDDHFHVRLTCPPGMAGCENQAAPPPGDGCGAELAWWFKPHPPPKEPTKPPPEIVLANLPAPCAGVLSAAPGGVETEAAKVAPVPKPRPAN
jgi:penicillin-insensitive murein endopeptidase